MGFGAYIIWRQRQKIFYKRKENEGKKWIAFPMETETETERTNTSKNNQITNV